MRVIFTPTAEQDLDEIWFEIAQDSESSADRVIDRIRERSSKLSDFPELGPTRPDIAKSARSLTVGNYLILYQPTDKSVEVIRVVHGARDLTTLF